jgi:hypothetical protein
MIKIDLKNRGNIIAIFFYISLILSCNGCSVKNNWAEKIKNVDDFINQFPLSNNLNYEIFIDDTVNLLNPYSLLIVDNLLLVENATNSSSFLISVFSLETRKFIGEILKRGKGPNEYIGARYFNFRNDTLMLLDYFHKRVCLFSKNKIISLSSLPDRCFALNESIDGELLEQLFYFDEQIITTGAFINGRFGIFTIGGILLKKFGEYPKFNYSDTLSHFHLGNLFGANSCFCSNSDLSKIAAVSEYSLNLYSYNQTNKSFHEYLNLQWNNPTIVTTGFKNGYPFVGRLMNDGYTGSGNFVSADKYMIFPFSGISKKEIMLSGIEDYYRFLMIMDWNGKPVVCFELEKNINRTLVKDVNEKYVYSISTNANSGYKQIVRFEISEIILEANKQEL